jgi:myb proto-oncogene protein
VVIDLQAQFGNKWARIATYLSGRTDNDVKNFWSTRQKRLARLLRAPAPRRRPGAGSGRQSCASASSSHARDSPAQKVTGITACIIICLSL